MPSLQDLPFEIKSIILYYYLDSDLHCHHEELVEYSKLYTIRTLVVLMPNMHDEVSGHLARLEQHRVKAIKELQASWEVAFPAPTTFLEAAREMFTMSLVWRQQEEEVFIRDSKTLPFLKRDWRERLVWEDRFREFEASCKLVWHVRDMYTGDDDGRDELRQDMEELWRQWKCFRGRKERWPWERWRDICLKTSPSM
jgi:hypothetical protein